MTVPIILNGERRGTLELRRDGAFTLFEARCAMQPGLVRLAVFGGGRRGYLGVLQPEGEGLALRRRLSRAAMRTFPERIEYAGEAEEKHPEQKHNAAAYEKRAGAEREQAVPQPNREQLIPRPNREQITSQPEQEHNAAAYENAAALEKTSYEKWEEREDGSLVLTEGRTHWVALPCALRREQRGVRVRKIGGRDYLVFRC